MRRLFGSFIDIRKGERTLTALMFSYYYLALVTNYFLKPARDSLFLTRLGAQRLPLTFILIAVIVLPVTIFYIRASRSFGLVRLINATTAVLIVNLVLFRWLIPLDQTWVYYAFYVWVSIYGVLITSQFWLCANTVFNPAQAKRLFPLLNVGGILGATTGGEVTSFIVQRFGVHTENLLLFGVGFLAVCIGLLNAVWSLRGTADPERPVPVYTEERGQETLRQLFNPIRRSRQLMFIVGIISTMVMVTSFVDFQFKTISLAAFPTKAALTAFLGQFYGRVGLVTLLVQLLLTSRFLRVLGVGGAILFLPGSLVLGSAAMFIAPGLWTGVVLRGADQTFRYSINKTGLELLFLPVPLDLKKRTKVVIDVFVDQWAQGVSGVLLLLFTGALGLSTRSLSLVVIALAAVWVVFALRVRQEYVNAFRKALERREIDLGEIRMSIGEASTVNTLLAALSSQNERQVVYALDLLASAQGVDLLPSVQPLLAHRSAEVRLKALRTLHTQELEVAVADLERLLNDDDPEVSLEAMSLLCRQTEGDRLRRLRGYLEHQDPQVQSAAVVCIAEHRAPEEHRLVDEKMIQSLLSRDGRDGERVRVQVARALGALNLPNLRTYVMRLMEDPSPVVASRAIQSAGQTQDRLFVPILLAKLADHQHRANARRALAAFGPRVLGTLRDYLIDETVDLAIRRDVPRVLRAIPTQESVDLLLDHIERVPRSLKYPVVKALNTLRVQYPALRIDPNAVNRALIDEARTYYEIVQVRSLYRDPPDGPAIALLNRALAEKQQEQVELMFRLLGLQYPPRDIYHAYQGMISQNQAVRASALEFLDNVLRNEAKRYLFPILDPVSVDDTIHKGQELFGQRIERREQALACLIHGHDAWLRACALYTITRPVPTEIVPLIEEARHDPDPVVRETASMVLSDVSGQGHPPLTTD